MNTINILWIDDQIQELLELFSDKKYNIYPVKNEQAAENELKQNGHLLNAIITDGNFNHKYDTPNDEHDRRGLSQLLQYVDEHYPELPVFLYTGRGITPGEEFYVAMMDDRDEPSAESFKKHFCTTDGQANGNRWIGKNDKGIPELLALVAEEVDKTKESRRISRIERCHADVLSTAETFGLHAVTHSALLLADNLLAADNADISQSVADMDNGLHSLLDELHAQKLVSAKIETPWALAVFLTKGSYNLKSHDGDDYIKDTKGLYNSYPTAATSLNLLARGLQDTPSRYAYVALVMAFCDFLLATKGVIDEQKTASAKPWEDRTHTGDAREVVKAPLPVQLSDKDKFVSLPTGQLCRVVERKGEKFNKDEKILIDPDSIQLNRQAVFPLIALRSNLVIE